MFVTVVYTLLYLFTNFCRLIGWFRWQVEGLERLPPRQAGGMVIVMNHIHWMDIPVVGTVLPLRYRLSWLAKAELFRNPLVGWFLRLMHVIPIQRGKSDAAALDAAARALRNGAVLLVFPEGHRSRTGVLQPGRGGAVRLAIQADVPIVPCAVRGTEAGLWGTLRRKPVLVQIGEPYRVASFPDGQIPADQMERLTADMMYRIASMLPAAWRGPYGDRNTLPSDERSATQPTPSAASTRHQT